ncbi:hypothetical protein BCR33DRAFT_721853 [Rhizoclosmatium globosum]|uniref:Uncharacterized protein n=1 Tax=Rhizoclosmatium globosum TaxID=329046 RepID=A0A1Y2BPE9_9FUNG|nr:hypothetical protein BCR33DRAFT_721853 [Rhizoclosmatium globosum]|eukprot:ORY36624.1 hypothetical protein BCR33DRAFT_721853 [Rhizoclosmatium globosum]
MESSSNSPRRTRSLPNLFQFPDVESIFQAASSSTQPSSQFSPVIQPSYSPSLTGFPLSNGSSGSGSGSGSSQEEQILSQLALYNSYNQNAFVFPANQMSPMLMQHNSISSQLLSFVPQQFDTDVSTTSVKKRKSMSFQKPPLLPNGSYTPQHSLQQLQTNPAFSPIMTPQPVENSRPATRSRRANSSTPPVASPLLPPNSLLLKTSLIPGAEVPRAIPAGAVVARSTGVDKSITTEASTVRFQSALVNVVKRRGSLSSMRSLSSKSLADDSDFLSTSAPSSSVASPSATPVQKVSGLRSMSEVLKAAKQSLELKSGTENPMSHFSNMMLASQSPVEPNTTPGFPMQMPQDDDLMKLLNFDGIDTSGLFATAGLDNTMSELEFSSLANMANEMYAMSGQQMSGLTPLLGPMTLFPTPPREGGGAAAGGPSQVPPVYWGMNAPLQQQLQQQQQQQQLQQQYDALSKLDDKELTALLNNSEYMPFKFEL